MKNLDKVVEAKGFDFAYLRGMIKEFNAAGLSEKKINPVGKKEAVVERFVMGVEIVPEKKEKQIPEAVILLYNAYTNVMEEGAEEIVVGKVVEKTTEKGGKKGKVKKEKKKENGDVKKDAFGFTVGTKHNLFVEFLRKSPKTMKEVKLELGDTMYNAWKAIKDSGKGKIVDGKMVLK